MRTSDIEESMDENELYKKREEKREKTLESGQRRG